MDVRVALVVAGLSWVAGVLTVLVIAFWSDRRG